MSRIFILGIDGGEFRVIDYLAAAGQLPNLSRLIKKGVRLDLTSTIPPITPAAWVSFYTGTNPGRHGIIDFLARRRDSYRLHPVHRTMVTGKTLWQTAAEAGLRSLIINVPVTYPPDEINGWMISGMDTPGPNNQYTHPQELKKEILDLVPGYRPDVHVSRRILKQDRDLQKWYIEEVLGLEELRMKVISHLAENRPWDLAVAVLVAADRLQHVFWDSVEKAIAKSEIPLPPDPAGAVFEAYRAVDRFLPRILKLIGADDHLMIISDHGFGPLDMDVNLNAILAQSGFLKFKKAPLSSLLRKDITRRLKSYLPTRARALLWHLLPPPEAQRLEGLKALEEMVDWEETKAYALGYLGGIYLNLKGREPQGIILPDNYTGTIEELSMALDNFRDPINDTKLITNIARRDEIYHGPKTSGLPDLILTLKDHRAIARHSFTGSGDSLFSKPLEALGRLSHSGSHRPLGIFIGSGPGFEKLVIPEKASLIDIYPTCLDLFDLRISKHIDGRSLIKLKTPSIDEEKDQHDYEETSGPAESSLSPEEEQEVLDNLRDLGYF